LLEHCAAGGWASHAPIAGKSSASKRNRAVRLQKRLRQRLPWLSSKARSLLPSSEHCIFARARSSPAGEFQRLEYDSWSQIQGDSALPPGALIDWLSL